MKESRNFIVRDVMFSEIKLIESKKFSDNRGFFSEVFNVGQFKELGLPHSFVQENLSFSKYKVIRGLHFQKKKPQAKLVRVLRGDIWDVVVDIRRGSETYGKWSAIRLIPTMGMLYVPKGFAHGFCSLDPHGSFVSYLVDAPYDQEDEGGIHWNDPVLKINWPTIDPIVSEKDEKLPELISSHLERS